MSQAHNIVPHSSFLQKIVTPQGILVTSIGVALATIVVLGLILGCPANVSLMAGGGAFVVSALILFAVRPIVLRKTLKQSVSKPQEALGATPSAVPVREEPATGVVVEESHVGEEGVHVPVSEEVVEEDEDIARIVQRVSSELGVSVEEEERDRSVLEAAPSVVAAPVQEELDIGAEEAAIQEVAPTPIVQPLLRSMSSAELFDTFVELGGESKEEVFRRLPSLAELKELFVWFDGSEFAEYCVDQRGCDDKIGELEQQLSEENREEGGEQVEKLQQLRKSRDVISFFTALRKLGQYSLEKRRELVEDVTSHLLYFFRNCESEAYKSIEFRDWFGFKIATLGLEECSKIEDDGSDELIQEDLNALLRRCCVFATDALSDELYKDKIDIEKVIYCKKLLVGLITSGRGGQDYSYWDVDGLKAEIANLEERLDGAVVEAMAEHDEERYVEVPNVSVVRRDEVVVPSSVDMLEVAALSVSEDPNVEQEAAPALEATAGQDSSAEVVPDVGASSVQPDPVELSDLNEDSSDDELEEVAPTPIVQPLLRSMSSAELFDTFVELGRESKEEVFGRLSGLAELKELFVWFDGSEFAEYCVAQCWCRDKIGELEEQLRRLGAGDEERGRVEFKLAQLKRSHDVIHFFSALRTFRGYLRGRDKRWEAQTFVACLSDFIEFCKNEVYRSKLFRDWVEFKIAVLSLEECSKFNDNGLEPRAVTMLRRCSLCATYSVNNALYRGLIDIEKVISCKRRLILERVKNGNDEAIYSTQEADRLWEEIDRLGSMLRPRS